MKEKKVIIFTGSGISVESGIPTYRGSDGTWENESIDEVANQVTWRANYDKVHSFYDNQRIKLKDVEPNLAHKMIAEIQKVHDAIIITQNVDDLLERAGCTDVIHLHGELTKIECQSCYHVWDVGYNEHDKHCPVCTSDDLKPFVVFFFGEAPEYLKLYDALKHLYNPESIVVVAGTQGNVVSINEFIKRTSAKKLLNNLEESEHIDSEIFDELFLEKATTAFPKIKEYIDKNFKKD